MFSKRDLNLSLAHYQELLHEVRVRLTINGAPNVAAFRWFRETPQAAFLVRQYFHANLLERLTTPPFLTVVEKRWLAFQLLQALQQCHELGVCHGDIKAENVMVTSWNWLFLTDLANFKPAALPQDDPADFSYFFDSSARRSATSRPSASSTAPRRRATISRASSCCFHGRFLGGLRAPRALRRGRPVFDLPALLRYRRGLPEEHDAYVAKLAASLPADELPDARRLLCDMTARDARGRPKAAECLQRGRACALFPEAFFTFAYGFFSSLRLLDHDRQAELLCDNYELLLRELGPPAGKAPRPSSVAGDGAAEAAAAHAAGYLRRVEESWRDEKGGGAASAAAAAARGAAGRAARAAPAAAPTAAPGGALVLVVTSLCCAVRNVRSPSRKLRLLDVLLKVALRSADAVKTQRVLPFFMACLADPAPSVRAEAVALIASLLAEVVTLQPSDPRLMADYVLPALSKLAADGDVAVRCALAAHLGRIAQAAHRFLEIAQWMRAASLNSGDESGGGPRSAEAAAHLRSFDAELATLQKLVSNLVEQLLTDAHAGQSAVKRALVGDVARSAPSSNAKRSPTSCYRCSSRFSTIRTLRSAEPSSSRSRGCAPSSAARRYKPSCSRASCRRSPTSKKPWSRRRCTRSAASPTSACTPARRYWTLRGRSRRCSAIQTLGCATEPSDSSPASPRTSPPPRPTAWSGPSSNPSSSVLLLS